MNVSIQHSIRRGEVISFNRAAGFNLVVSINRARYYRTKLPGIYLLRTQGNGKLVYMSIGPISNALLDPRKESTASRMALGGLVLWEPFSR